MSGVVHVGAHRGEEVPRYLLEERNPIICFEPQALDWNIPNEVCLVRAALGDRSGTLEMRIPHHLHITPKRDTMSATGLKLNHQRAREIGWTPTPYDTTQVPLLRFDEWADEHEFKRESCDFLAIDVQGMELHVLRGFGDYLDSFSRILVECSDPPVYDGGSSASEVVEFLAAKGFVQTTPTVPHGDIEFGRVSNVR